MLKDTQNIAQLDQENIALPDDYGRAFLKQTPENRKYDLERKSVFPRSGTKISVTVSKCFGLTEYNCGKNLLLLAYLQPGQR
jgi:hypothetical protein